jgi:3-mercaptopyruvate sulfurtransferase SseA
MAAVIAPQGPNVNDPLPRLMEPQELGPTPRPGVLLVHVAGAAAYQAAHIAGAVLVEPGELVAGTPPAPGKLPSPGQLEALFTRLGYHPDLDIVVYDDEGGGWAGRFIWTLDIFGHRRWSYLDGGIHAWHAAGLPLASGPGPAPAATPVTLHLDLSPVAEVEDVLAAIDDAGSVIWDARSEAEYLGLRTGSRRAGHVPGAVNIDWQALMDPARQLRLITNLRELLAAHGITPDKRVITHCQTHHRSGLTYLAARLLDYPAIRAYHGSWSEWGNLEDTPVETGR